MPANGRRDLIRRLKVKYASPTDISVGRTPKLQPSGSWFLSIALSTVVVVTVWWWWVQINNSQSGSHLFQYMLTETGPWTVIEGYSKWAEPTLFHHSKECIKHLEYRRVNFWQGYLCVWHFTHHSTAACESMASSDAVKLTILLFYVCGVLDNPGYADRCQDSTSE